MSLYDIWFDSNKGRLAYERIDSKTVTEMRLMGGFKPRISLFSPKRLLPIFKFSLNGYKYPVLRR